MEDGIHKVKDDRATVNLNDYFRILCKRAGIIILVVILFAAVAFVNDKRKETFRYVTATSILVQGNRNMSASADLVKSLEVLEKAVERLSGEFDVNVSKLRANISVLRIEDTRRIEITVKAPSAKEAEETARVVRDESIAKIARFLDEAVYEFTELEDLRGVLKRGNLVDLGKVEIIQGVGPARRISNVNIKKDVFFAAVYGFVLCAGLLALKFLIHEAGRPIKRPEDIVRYLGEEVLAVVPAGKGRGGKTAKAGLKEEPFRLLRTNLIALCGTGKVFGFVGTAQGDGAEDAAFYTAKSLAGIGKNVLYIDACIYGAPAGKNAGCPGLCGLIGGGAECGGAVLDTEYDGLHMIPAGDIKNAPPEMFGREAFKKLLSELREKYDYVILSAPPMKSHVDAAIIGKECDGMIYVVKSDAVTCVLARTIEGQLKKAGANLIGTVLTGADMKNDSYYGKYYYSYQEKGLAAMKPLTGR